MFYNDDLRTGSDSCSRLRCRAVRPLDGIRIIDTSTGPVGGLATMVLADFGADVIKIEPPGGDRFRSLSGSPLWLRGKQSVTLDLHTVEGLASLHSLVATADVVVTSGPPGRARRWGIDAAGCEVWNRSVVHCSITGWGEVGPLADFPGYVSTVAAVAGRMFAFSGQLRRPGPVYSAVPVAAHAAAHGAVQGIVSGLIARLRTGQSQRVATSLLQALLPYDLVELLLVQLAERNGVAMPNPAITDMPTLNYHPVMAKDGTWIQCGNLLEHLFLSFLDAIDLYGELLADERFLESPAHWTSDAVEHARDQILLRMEEKTANEWMAIFFENGNVAAEPFRSPAQALSHPDLVENGHVVEVDDPLLGRIAMIGAIAKLDATPADPTRRAPSVGEQNHEVLARLQDAPEIDLAVASRETTRAYDTRAYDLSDTRVQQPSSSRSVRLLDGTTVVEFASVIAAPLGAAMLGDLGARVIRIEPIEGDSFRHLQPNGVMAVKTTASKESICIDLKQAEGRAIARALVAKADVLIHNYRPGVPERLGIGYSELHQAFPKLVWVSVNGYGPNGPGSHRPATHPVAGASMGGAGYQAGHAATRACVGLTDIRENARQLMRANEPSPDPNTSVIVASATLIALLARQRFDLGQAVYVDMLCANAHANADAFLSYQGMATRPEIDEQHFGTGPCSRLYPASTGWVFFEVTTAQEWKRFCHVADCPELVDSVGFSGRGATPGNAVQLVEQLTAIFARRDAADWQAQFGAANVACVQADAESPGSFYAHHEQMRVNGFVPMVTHARFGDIRRWGPLVSIGSAAGVSNISGAPGNAPQGGPGVLAGEHTDRLLVELGFDTEAISRLRTSGVVASEAVTL